MNFICHVLLLGGNNLLLLLLFSSIYSLQYLFYTYIKIHTSLSKCNTYLQYIHLMNTSQYSIDFAITWILNTYMLWTPAYTPGDGQTSRVYSNNPVLHLYISCYVTVNKTVLSYLLLRLLPQWWPRSGCTLCTVHCTLYLCTLTLTHRHLQALVAFSFAFKVKFLVPILQCALHWLQLSKSFSLMFLLRNLQTFYFVFLLEVGRSYHST